VGQGRLQRGSYHLAKEKAWGVEEARKTPSLSSLKRKKERWLLNVIYPSWFSHSKHSHMLLHAEPPTCIWLWDGTHTGAGGDTEASAVLRVEKSRAHLAVARDRVWASLRLPPSAEVQPAARFSTQAVPPDGPSSPRSSFATKWNFIWLLS